MKRCKICEKPLAEHNKSGLCHHHGQKLLHEKWRKEHKEYISKYQKKRYQRLKGEKEE